MLYKHHNGLVKQLKKGITLHKKIEQIRGLYLLTYYIGPLDNIYNFGKDKKVDRNQNDLG